MVLRAFHLPKSLQCKLGEERAAGSSPWWSWAQAALTYSHPSEVRTSMCTRSASLSNPATDLGKEGRRELSDPGPQTASGKHSGWSRSSVEAHSSLFLHWSYSTNTGNPLLTRAPIMPCSPRQCRNHSTELQLHFFNLWDITSWAFGWVFISTFPSQCVERGRSSTNICRMKDYNTFI